MRGSGRGGEEGDGSSKGVYQEEESSLPLLAMETAMNPLCNATLLVARRVYRS